MSDAELDDVYQMGDVLLMNDDFIRLEREYRARGLLFPDER